MSTKEPNRNKTDQSKQLMRFGLILLGIVLLFIVMLRVIDADKTPQVTPTIDTTNWTEQAAADGSFSVLLPPDLISVEGADRFANVGIHAASDTKTFIFSVLDSPENNTAVSGLDKALAIYDPTGAAQRSNFTTLSEAATGYILQLDSGKFQFVAANEQMYTDTSFAENRLDDETILAIMSSFKLN